MRTHWVMAGSMMLIVPALAARWPTPVQLSQALASFEHSADRPRVKNIRCHVLGDPTEFFCSYQQSKSWTGWQGYSVIVATDGDHWVVIDEPHQKKAG